MMVAETIDTMVSHLLKEIALEYCLQNAGVVTALERPLKDDRDSAEQVALPKYQSQHLSS